MWSWQEWDVLGPRTVASGTPYECHALYAVFDDLNGDGKADLAIVTESGGIDIFLADGEPGTLQFGWQPCLGHALSIGNPVLFRDIDGDGGSHQASSTLVLSNMFQVGRTICLSTVKGKAEVTRCRGCTRL